MSLLFLVYLKVPWQSEQKDINEEMKLAAAYAIADSVDESKLNADNILPDPFDRNIPKAVAKSSS